MIDATMDILRVRRDEQVALAGVLVAMFADEPSEAVRRLEAVESSAHECAGLVNGRRERQKAALYRRVGAMAHDMLPMVSQLATRAVASREQRAPGEAPDV